MGSRLHEPSTVRVLRYMVLSSNNSQSATNTFGAWLSSKLDGLAYVISPLLPVNPRVSLSSVTIEDNLWHNRPYEIESPELHGYLSWLTSRQITPHVKSTLRWFC